MKNSVFIFFFFSAFLLFSLNAAFAETLDGSGFPMNKKALWKYGGTVSKMEANEKVKEYKIDLKMEIVEIIDRGNVTAAVIKGHPFDAISLDEKGRCERGNYILIKCGRDKYYLIYGESYAETLKKLRDPEDGLGAIVKESDILLETPLYEGKTFGEAEQITRTDNSYCWYVEKSSEADLKNIKGAGIDGSVKQFELRYRTNPDLQVINFVPGFGITEYSYNHNGTPHNVDLKLVEYKAGNADGKKAVSKEEARKIAEAECAKKGYEWKKPNLIEKGDFYEINTNFGSLGNNVYIKINKADGKVADIHRVGP